ncbi:MAG TPA: ABC transporter permease [Bacteroidetes bacterium]|nr:ABC transporter permease [Bacteroidota bacterium]
MKPVLVIARNTFRETTRNRVMLTILFFALGMVVLSLIVSNWSVYQQAKILKDFGLAAISLFGLLIALFVGIQALYQEIEKHTIYMLVSKPIHRWQILLGKYLGLAGTVFVNVAAIAVCLLLADWQVGGSVDWGLLKGVLLSLVEIDLVLAWAVFFSTVASLFLSALLTVVVFVAGHLAPALWLHLQLHPDTPGHTLLLALYTIIPNLEEFNIRAAVVEHLPLPPDTVPAALLYGIAYISILVLASSWILERKDLT